MILHELIAARAWNSYVQARRYSHKLVNLAAKNKVSWTMIHTFLANMEGFVIRSTEDHRLQRSAVRTTPKDGVGFHIPFQTSKIEYPTSKTQRENLGGPRISTATSSSNEQSSKTSPDTSHHQNPKYQTMLHLGAREIFDLHEAGLLAKLPDVAIEEIDDKNKSDTLVKVIVVMQTMWFLLQVALRAYNH